MTTLSRDEMKKVIGGDAPAADECNLNQAACVFAGHSGKAKSCNNSFCCCA